MKLERERVRITPAQLRDHVFKAVEPNGSGVYEDHVEVEVPVVAGMELTVHVAYGTDGKYHFSRTIRNTTGVSSSWPGFGIRDDRAVNVNVTAGFCDIVLKLMEREEFAGHQRHLWEAIRQARRPV